MVNKRVPSGHKYIFVLGGVMSGVGKGIAVASIGKIKSAGGDFLIGDGSTGPVTAAIKAKLVGIQRGDIADAHSWVRRVV